MIPTDLKYTKTHEWVRLEGDVVTMGITKYAAEQLGDIVFVELPGVGKKLAAAGVLGVIESVKAAVEIFAPVAGEVTDTNQAVATNLTLISNDPYGAGWMVKLRPENPIELENLMDGLQYERFLNEQQG